MRILAIDTSCDESCAAIVDTEQWKLLADVVHSHVDSMTLYGGVVPEIASREHLKGLPLAVHQALETAKLDIKEIDWFVVTHRPGLMGALLVGVSFVKALAFSMNKPFSMLNHIEGHLFSPLLGTLEGGEVPAFPWVSLVVSGGHTELFLVRSPKEVRWLGGTLDDAAGEAFDKIGKLLELPYPAGPVIDRWVREEATDEMRSRFKFPVAAMKPFHFSYSGLKTSVLNQTQKLKTVTEEDKLAIAASSQEAIIAPLVREVREAQTKFGVDQIVVAGGVACNSRFRALLPEAYFPAPRHCTDNAAMIALLGALYHREGILQPSEFTETAHPGMDFEVYSG